MVRAVVSDVVNAKILRPRPQPSTQGQGKAWIFEANATGPEANAFKHTVRVEIKIDSTSDSVTR